jgi:hypothetical protein
MRGHLLVAVALVAAGAEVEALDWVSSDCIALISMIVYLLKLYGPNVVLSVYLSMSLNKM